MILTSHPVLVMLLYLLHKQAFATTFYTSTAFSVPTSTSEQYNKSLSYKNETRLVALIGIKGKNKNVNGIKTKLAFSNIDASFKSNESEKDEWPSATMKVIIENNNNNENGNNVHDSPTHGYNDVDEEKEQRDNNDNREDGGDIDDNTDYDSDDDSDYDSDDDSDDDDDDDDDYNDGGIDDDREDSDNNKRSVFFTPHIDRTDSPSTSKTGIAPSTTTITVGGEIFTTVTGSKTFLTTTGASTIISTMDKELFTSTFRGHFRTTAINDNPTPTPTTVTSYYIPTGFSTYVITQTMTTTQSVLTTYTNSVGSTVVRTIFRTFNFEEHETTTSRHQRTWGIDIFTNTPSVYWTTDFNGLRIQTTEYLPHRPTTAITSTIIPTTTATIRRIPITVTTTNPFGGLTTYTTYSTPTPTSIPYSTSTLATYTTVYWTRGPDGRPIQTTDHRRPKITPYTTRLSTNALGIITTLISYSTFFPTSTITITPTRSDTENHPQSTTTITEYEGPQSTLTLYPYPTETYTHTFPNGRKTTLFPEPYPYPSPPQIVTLTSGGTVYLTTVFHTARPYPSLTTVDGNVYIAYPTPYSVPPFQYTTTDDLGSVYTVFPNPTPFVYSTTNVFGTVVTFYPTGLSTNPNPTTTTTQTSS
eukprot:Awhi_evm1s1924